MAAGGEEPTEQPGGLITDHAAIVFLGIDDALHYSEEQRRALAEQYPPHERKARLQGIPQLGSGAVYPVEEESIVTDAVPIPEHWARLAALDFGWDHPTAAVEIAWDRDADVIYVTKAYRVRQQTVALHAAALKPWGDWLPWAWPRDGLSHGKGGDAPLADQYRRAGMNLLADAAAFQDGGVSVEAGIMEILDRMQTGRFKVFRHLLDWLEEFRLYHRKDGKIVEVNDDLMDATRYDIMCLRHAVTKPKPRRVQSQGWIV